MKTKYLCLNCGHMFNEIGKTNEPHKFGECPECGSGNYLEDDIDIADRLRDWLDPWHPASEPPENGLHKVYDSLFSNSLLIKYYDEEIDDDIYCSGYANVTAKKYFNDHHGWIEHPVSWRDLPPLEVKP
jgi:DNA-directed RNA polymerase subunit RPC12/RpoP